MKNDPIVINADSLRRMQGVYAAQKDGLDDHLHKRIPWAAEGNLPGALPEANAFLNDPLPLRLGGAGFTEAGALGGAGNAVRTGLVDRFKGAYKEIAELEYAIRYLLEDSEATEHLSTLTAAQFGNFLKTT